MVMVDKERLPLGKFLTEEGIVPGVDVRKLLVPNVVTTEDGPVKETEVRMILPVDKEELDDIYHESWERTRNITTDEERHNLSRLAFKNPVPANPGNNLTFFTGIGSKKERRDHTGTITIPVQPFP